MPASQRPLRVFLCHAAKDKPIVRELYRRLDAQNWVKAWLDTDQILPGQNWREAIEEAVETADIVIICLSNNSVTKEGYIQREMRYAQDISLEKPEGTIFLVPLKLEECEAPRGLRIYQWIDYFGEEKEQNYERLLRSLRVRWETITHKEGEENRRLETQRGDQTQDIQKEPKAHTERVVPQVTIPRSIAFAIIGFLLGVLGNLFAAWIQQSVLQDSFTPSSVTLIISLTIIGIVAGTYIDRNKPKAPLLTKQINSRIIYWVIAALITGAIVINALAVLFSGSFRNQPTTIYFVVDATENMQPIFTSVREQVQKAASTVRNDSRIGLRVYGGENNSDSLCQDSQQILVPSEYPKAQSLLDRVLAGVQPVGHSSMTGAVLEALFSDIQMEERPVKLILITSGIDPICDPPAADFLKDRAKDIGRNVELLIISIGDQDENSYRILESYATAFGGHYLPIANPESLPSLVQSVSLYGYGYGYPFYGQTTVPDQ